MSNTAGDPRTAPKAAAGVPTVRSVEKAFTVLEAFTNRERYLSLGTIAEITGLDKSAVQRLTRTLIGLGYLEQDPGTRHYCIGRRVLDLSFGYLQSNDLVERAAPVLIDLRKAARERVDLTLIDGNDILYVFRLQSKRETLHAALVGRRVPIYCSAGGRAIMARLPREEAEAMLARANPQPVTPHTLTDRDALLAEVDKARARGFAFQSQEWRLGELVVAAAVLNRDEAPVAAVHIAGSTTEWAPEEFAEKMGPLVLAAAQDIRG